MIDRRQRDELATALRQFLSGRTDLEGSWRRPAFGRMRDHGVAAIVAELEDWSSARHGHRVRAGELEAEVRDALLRSVLFLHGDREYGWHLGNEFGWLRRLLRSEAGDPEVWPFFRRADLEEARARPCRLGGGAEPR